MCSLMDINVHHQFCVINIGLSMEFDLENSAKEASFGLLHAFLHFLSHLNV